jgi:hypothetical protein
MILNLFDATPDSEPIKEESLKRGALSPSHYAIVEADYEYQIEQWVIDLAKDNPLVVRAECADLGRKWVRDSATTMAEVNYWDMDNGIKRSSKEE